jgi:hypothetical protein
LGNIGNLKKRFLHCQTYAAFTFSEDFDTRFHTPDNKAGFCAETTTSNEIQVAQ